MLTRLWHRFRASPPRARRGRNRRKPSRRMGVERLEERCVPFARGYEAAGMALPEWTELTDEPGDRVVIAPPAGKEAVRRLSRYRTALVSGWALDGGFWRVFGADQAIPFSDHCDFDELIEVIERSGADQVYTVHGFADDFAKHLKRRGIRAHPLHASEQLALALW